MSAAALTPRVRVMVICDEATPDETEPGVFDLRGVRQYVVADAFPATHDLSVYFLLSSARRGVFEGKLLVVESMTDKTLRYAKFSVDFEWDNQIVPLQLDAGECHFADPGNYEIQVWFTAAGGEEALKGEFLFEVLD